MLLDATAYLKARAPVPQTVIAGEGEGPLHAHLSARIEHEALPARLLGQRDDVFALPEAADVLILPSVWEGQPLVLQEMLRAGRPIVASRAGGIPTVTGDGPALLVEPGDAKSFADSVEEILDSPELSGRLTRAARARASALPTVEDAFDQVIGVYTDVMTRRRTGRSPAPSPRIPR